MTRILFVLLAAGLTTGLALHLAVGDYWRSLGFAFCLVCFLVVRDDLTVQP